MDQNHRIPLLGDYWWSLYMFQRWRDIAIFRLRYEQGENCILLSNMWLRVGQVARQVPLVPIVELVCGRSSKQRGGFEK